MNGFSRAYNRIVLGHPKVVLIVLLLLLSFFSYHAKDFKLDASPDTLLLEDDKDLKIFRETIARYDIKEFFMVTFAPYEDLFSEGSLKHLKELREELRSLERADSVVTLLDIPLLQTSGVELSKITQENIKTLEGPGVDIERAKREILESPVYKDLVLSADGQTTALVIYLKQDTYFSELSEKRNQLLSKKSSATLSQSEQSQLEKYMAEYEDHYAAYTKQRHQDVDKIRSIIRPYKKYAEVHLGGVPMVADDMITFISNDLVVFGFGVLIFIVATLAILFREIRWVILPLLSCFFAVSIMIGVLGFLNWKVTVISSNFISLMLILTMSMNIHLAVRYRQLCNDMSLESQTDIVSTTAQKMVRPCLYAALTTILAFSSLVFSGIRPVIDFGWMMAIGLCVTFLTSFLLFPAVLMLLKKSSSSITYKRKSPITSRLASIAESHGGKVIILSIVLAVISVIGISKLEVENSFINYFSRKTEIYQGMKLIDDKLGGTMPLDVILHFGEHQSNSAADDTSVGTDHDFLEQDDWAGEHDPRDYWLTPYKVEKIKEVHDYLSGLPEIGKVLSLASIIRVAEQLYEGKEFGGLELGVLNKKIPERIRSEIVDPYVSVDNNEARISLRIIDSLEDIRRKDLLEKISSDLSNNFGLSESRVTVAGMLVIYNNMLQSLFRSQILTLGIVLLGIAIMLLILFRSIVLSIIGIIPNLLAIGIVLGIMGLMDISLDIMTITIAAITMGIAIDNSIHYIYRFREEFAKNDGYAETLHLCHGTVGRAILNTSVTIIFGFSILVLSNFLPTIYFGIFTGLAMAIALLSVLALLPKLIIVWRPFKTHSS
ncbi:MAG: RND family transporter [Deltaproteobacteria bacterium]|nr:MAG: RND family transporter [Deltaproteobacteria bacterium]